MIFTDSTIEIEAFTRIYLAGFYTFVAVFYTLRVVLIKKASANEVIFPGERFFTTWWNHMTFRFFRVAIWMVCLFRVFFPEIDNYLGGISALQSTPTILSGNILITLGFILTLVVHYNLGKDWRSGIDPKGPSKIISHGFYKYSRNPMFIFIAVSQLGFFLALPTIFSLVCLVVGVYTLKKQTQSEELYLSNAFPKEYQHYSSVVPRWL